MDARRFGGVSGFSDEGGDGVVRGGCGAVFDVAAWEDWGDEDLHGRGDAEEGLEEEPVGQDSGWPKAGAWMEVVGSDGQDDGAGSEGGYEG